MSPRGRAVAGGRSVVLGVAGAIERPTGGLAAERTAEDEVGQRQPGQQLAAVAHFGDADGEAHVGRVEVAEAVQGNAVGGVVARFKVPLATDAEGHLGFAAAFDEVALGFGHLLAVGVDHRHVVEPERQVAAVEDGADMGGVEHLPALGLGLEHARARELDQGAGLEVRTVEVDRHPARRRRRRGRPGPG
jgi:hypothetical protein